MPFNLNKQSSLRAEDADTGACIQGVQVTKERVYIFLLRWVAGCITVSARREDMPDGVGERWVINRMGAAHLDIQRYDFKSPEDFEFLSNLAMEGLGALPPPSPDERLPREAIVDEKYKKMVAASFAQ